MQFTGNLLSYHHLSCNYFWYSFEAYRELEEIDEIIVTFIVLSLKLLCATENLEKSEDSNKLRICNTIAYLAYPPWLSFKDFLSLRTISHGVR